MQYDVPSLTYQPYNSRLHSARTCI